MKKKLEHGERLAWLALAGLPHVGAERCRRLVEHFGSLPGALKAPVAAWERVVGASIARKARPGNGAIDWEWAQRQWERLEGLGGDLLTLDDEDYPSLLRQIASPPVVLFVLGDAAVLKMPCVGIVGTRRMSEYGREMARRLARELAARGYGVVSGMARGIDAAAHRGALAAGGQTVAVLGCGADVVYPAENERLHRAIQRQGAVVSEFPLGSAPEAGSFPRRNRIISGLSLGVVVAEAPTRSGALITADYAREQNREVFAVPGRVLEGRSTGCHRLIRDGAKLVEGVEDVLEEFEHLFGGAPAPRALEPEAAAPVVELEADERAVLEKLGHEAQHIDRLNKALELPAPAILDVLLRLELAGLVRQLPGKCFVRLGG